MKKLLLITLLTLTTTTTQAAPGKKECEVHEVVNSPSGQLVSILGLIGGLIEPVSGTIVLATSSFRHSKCPKPKLMTETEVKRMIEEALMEAGK